MKFVLLWSLKANVDQLAMAELMGRRAEYKFPKGMKVLNEYWTSKASPAVVQIIEAKESAPLMINTVNWIDVMTVDIFPVIEWEEGLKAITRHLSED
jgi:hypothetical protein